MGYNTFFTSDTHFGHRLMLADSRRCPRPWHSIEAMNEDLIHNWNWMVGDNDHIYHLGDFSFMNAGKTVEILKRLQGFIHLIRGNHDRMSKPVLEYFESVDDIKEIRVAGQKIVMCHYAMMTWNKMHEGSWMLHGHSHGALQPDEYKKRFDVGIDSVVSSGLAETYRPVHFEDIRDGIMTFKKEFIPVDHHGTDTYDEGYECDGTNCPHQARDHKPLT
jgi:calcineurin-like phosphoesterase family protein